MFACSKCGLCCKSIGVNEVYRELDRGDGVCKNFDVKTNLCKIYESRPLICRVEEYYVENLSDSILKSDWFLMNEQSCIALKTIYS